MFSWTTATSAGVKFKDADLIGFPLRVVLGERGVKQGKLELKWRWEEKAEMIDLANAAVSITERIRLERASGERFGNWQRTKTKA